MNITQIILGSTAVMLLVAIVLSYSEMKTGEEQHGLKQSATQIMQDSARMQAELDRLRRGVVTSEVALEIPAQMTEGKLSEMEQQNELLRQQLASEEAMRKQAEEVAVDAAVAAEIAALPPEDPSQAKKDKRRARHITIATLMAQVIEVATEGDISVIVIDVKMPDQVHMGTKLAIRRGSEIIGSLAVSNIVEGNVFADPIQSSFVGGNIDVQVGDELILEPLF